MKYVLVTGARGGMGKAAVRALKESGYFVFALDRTDLDERKENIFPLTADITNEQSILKAFEQVRSVTDTLYAVLHFAGIYSLHSLVEMSGENLQRVFEVNLLGAARINRIFLPLLKSGSRIVITTSELAPLDPLPFTGVYAISKSALDKYAYSLRMELQLLGISVVVLRPGAVDTGMLDVSTDALEKFCQNTKLYPCNSKRFQRIVERVEARKIPTWKIGKKAVKILQVKRPKFVYKINRNPLLLLLNALPRRWQTAIIKQILR